MSRFSAEEWQHLPSEKRVQQCRTMAAEAHKLSTNGEAKLRQAFEQLAGQWNQLADEMEAEFAKRNLS